MSDLIRRQDAIEALEGAELFIYTDPDKAAQEIIEELPEATGICRRLIKEESGKWISDCGARVEGGDTARRCRIQDNEMEGMRMREWTEHEKDMIHTVMHMAYLEGIDEGKRQAQEVIRALSDKVSELYAKHEKDGTR